MAMTILPASAVIPDLEQQQLRMQEIVAANATCTVTLCSSPVARDRASVLCVEKMIVEVSAEALASGRWSGAQAHAAESA